MRKIKLRNATEHQIKKETIQIAQKNIRRKKNKFEIVITFSVKK